MTDAEREDAFQRFLALSANYVAKIRDDRDEAWHAEDIEARRELFMKRYTRPAPPVGLLTDLESIRA